MDFITLLDLHPWISVVGTISVAILVFLANLYFTKRIHKKNQEALLKNLLVEIYFLTKKSLKFENGKESSGGHIDYFRKCLERQKGWPHHDMRELRDLSDLDYSLKRKETSILKHLVFHANDKVKLLNFYRIGKLANDQNVRIWNYDKDYIKTVISELENILGNLKSKIEEDFGVQLSDSELKAIDQASSS